MTWLQLGKNIVKYKIAALSFLALSTLVMGYFAIQVKLSYEFTKAIPEDNPKFVIYKELLFINYDIISKHNKKNY